MSIIYDLAILLYEFSIKLAGLFGNKKAKAFITGRKGVFEMLNREINQQNYPICWFHCASLGEFEQARPLIEMIKQNYKVAVLLTFFSPSGYESKINYEFADIISYLPIDKPKNAKLFLQIVRPKLAIFTKYDLWKHYIDELYESRVPTFLISAVFRSKQIYFKKHGKLFGQLLKRFNWIFVQDDTSKNCLNTLGINQTSICGDTRVDRVLKIAEDAVSIDWLNQFKSNKKLFVIGSAWHYDWHLVKNIWDSLSKDYKLLIAPHNIDDNTIQSIKSNFEAYNPVLYSEYNKTNSSEIIILNTIGQLSACYKYADVVFVGGGFNKSGIHNILEPAVFGAPIFIGPNYKKFVEANDLIALGGLISVTTSQEVLEAVSNQNLLLKMGSVNKDYIIKSKGATNCICNQMKLEKYLETVA